MSRLLILLCMVGWALYTLHTNSNKSGDMVAHESKAFAAQPPAAQAATSTESQLQSIASAAAQSRHAIIPDETPLQAPANPAVPAPQTENTKSLSQADQESAPKPGSSQEPEEQLSVTSETSIRSGPSDSAQLIGRAHAGATLRVKSRDAGWVQFVDPFANETGWISMAYLEPTDAIENTPQPPKNAELETPKPTPKKMAKLRTPKPRHINPTYAQLPADREFVPRRRGGLFGLFLNRRF
jgi:uncharacterized protein YgiM (DUF1202 family)